MRLPRNPGWAMCGGLVVGLAALIGLGGSFRASAPTPEIIRLAKGNAPGLAAVSKGSRAQSEAVAMKYDRLPLAFEPNRAQVDSQVQFLARGVGYTLFLTPEESVLALSRRSKVARANGADSVLRVKLAGSNTHASFAGLDELPGKSNYIIGNRAENWRTNIPTYRQVARRDIYRGIDVIYYGTQRQLEYDFVVSPGANPRVIQLDFQGAENLQTDSAGNLIVSVPDGELRMQRPLAYQQAAGERRAVAANYIVQGASVTFQLAAYDPQLPLVIDPTLAYSTYLGGSNIDGANGIAVAPDFTAFIVGGTFSTNFPTAHPLQPNAGGPNDFPQDAFAAKISADGSTLLYSTYLGGAASDVANGVAVDTFGDAYVTGTTFSPDFPVTVDAFNTLCGGDGKCGTTLNPQGLVVSNAFVSKLNPAGSGLIYSGFLGEYENVRGQAIALDSDEIAYVTGQVDANFTPTVPIVLPAVPPPPFPITPSAFQTVHGAGTDAFVTKISATGTSIQYSSYLGGDGEDIGYGITVDSSAVAYVTGLTYSLNFPTAAALQGASGGAGDAFVSKINTRASGGPSLVFSTYLGGSGLDQGNGIGLDPTDNIYVAGLTFSNSFPFAPNGFQTTNHGEGDAFVVKLTPAGGFSYFTFLGGSLADSGVGVAADATGNAYVTGSTVSTDFPVTTPVFQHAYGGGNADAFVAKLSPTGAALTYSSYLGGTNTEIPGGIAVDTSGSAYVAGQTCSLDFPLSNPLQAAAGGSCDAFISKISVLGGLAINPAGLVFPAQSLGANSQPQAVTLTNTNDVAPITIGPVSIAGVNPGDFTETNTCSAALPPSGQCTVNVVFHPNGVGLRKASLMITDNALGSPQVVALNGSTSTVGLSATSLFFGTQAVGVASNPQTITVTNNNTVPLIISSVTASGDFSQTNNCSVPLQPSTTCVISVTYQPLADGNSIGALTLTDNGSGSPQVVLLTGTGFAQSPDFTVSATPSSATVSAGQAAVLHLTISPLTGFSQQVALGCSGLPRGASCSFSPNPVTVAASPATVTVTVNTAVRAFAAPMGTKFDLPVMVHNVARPLWFSLILVLTLTMLARLRRRPVLALLGLAALLAAGCGSGGSTGVPAGTPAGTSQFSVIATSGVLTHSTVITLQVN